MLTIETTGSVAHVSIDRPEARNALSGDLVRRLMTTLTDLDASSSTDAIVLDGTPPGFCAGSDLRELAGMDVAQMAAHEAETAALARRIALLDTPVLAAVEGFAMGGGFVLAVSCDLVITGRSAMWQLPEVSLGWIPPWGLKALVARVGPVTARRLTWGDQPIDGEEAHRRNVADEVVDDGAARHAADEIASRLSAMPAGSIASTKRAFAPLVLEGAETLDAEANRLFVADCNDPLAKASLSRFRRKQ